MKKYIFAVALIMPMAGTQAAFAQSVPCANYQAKMNTQCSQNGNSQGSHQACEAAIRQFAVCLSAIGGGVPQCQQQAQQGNKNCYDSSAPPANVCPGQLNQLASCIASAIASQNPGWNGNPNPPSGTLSGANPQSDFHPSKTNNGAAKTDYRVSCPYFVNDGSATGTTAPNEMQTIDNCRNLMKLPSPAPY